MICQFVERLNQLAPFFKFFLHSSQDISLPFVLEEDNKIAFFYVETFSIDDDNNCKSYYGQLVSFLGSNSV